MCYFTSFTKNRNFNAHPLLTKTKTQDTKLDTRLDTKPLTQSGTYALLFMEGRSGHDTIF